MADMRFNKRDPKPKNVVNTASAVGKATLDYVSKAAFVLLSACRTLEICSATICRQ